MAYYEGETLKERIERGPLALDEAVDITTQELAERATKNSGPSGRGTDQVYKGVIRAVKREFPGELTLRN